MKTILLAFLLFIGDRALAADAPCAKVDPAVTAPDGVPLCPSVVTETSMFAIFRCGMSAARSWHPPTGAEISSTKSMLQAVKANDMKAVMLHADKVGLQACRVVKPDDSYLVLFTKYGVKDYNGTFFMFRDPAKSSKVTIIAPHSGTDGYHSAAPLGFQETKAFAYIQNGHPKGANGVGRPADFSHSKTTLGFHAVKIFGDLWPKRVVWHVHGMKNPNSVLYRPLESVVAKPFERAVTKHTNISNFKGFNAFYEIDPPISTSPGLYVKSELPVRLFGNHKGLIIAKIVKELETYDWAWDEKVEIEVPGDEEVGELPVDVEADADDQIVVPGEVEGELATPPAPTANAWAGPPQKKRLGSPVLACVGIQWTDNKYSTAERCKASATRVANFFKEQSRGLFTMKPVGTEISVDMPCNRNNLKAAEAQVKAQVKASYYEVPVTCKAGGNHASGGIAHLTGFLYWVAAHEVGHLIGLGHSGAIKNGGYSQYGDLDSVMGGNIPRLALTAPQYYWLGWTPKEEVEIYDSAKSEYELKRVSAFKAPGKSIMFINSTDLGLPRVGVIAFPATCEACAGYYEWYNGSSHLIKKFNDEFTDPRSGLTIKVLGKNGANLKIQTTIVKPG